jgi:hypothetical protein
MFTICVRSYVEMVRALLLSAEERNMTYGREQDGNLEGPAVLISVDLSMDDFAGDKSYSRRGLVHVLCCGHSKTFMAITDLAQKPASSPTHKKQLNSNTQLDDTWRNVSNHDSCWKDAVDQEINKIYFSWSQEILKESGSGLAPKDLYQSAWINGIGAGVWKGIVVLRSDPNNGYPNGYGVVDLHHLTPKGY